ncbi:MAG: hypothetical protein HYU52_15265 [Acidobacteria bacterium]|nr:hypothetical protein [Acidobacteriota bacterium]
MLRHTAISFSLTLLLALGACRTTQPQSTSIPGTSLASADRHGIVSASVLPDPDAPKAQLEDGEELDAAYFHPDNPLPTYPPELVRLQLPPRDVVMRFVVGEKGDVVAIIPSPLAIHAGATHQQSFEESVRAALARWRVTPPTIRKFRPGPDSDADGKPDYSILVYRRPLKAFFDLQFVFEVVDGEPVVRSKAPEPDSP